MNLAIAITALLAFTAAAPTAQQQQPRRPASQTEAMYQASTASAERKFQHIAQNAEQSQPDQRPTVLTDREVNAYVNSGNVKLPTGVKSVKFGGRPGVIDATARVDFDQITASRHSSNPLLSLFSGVHDVHVVANGEGSGGQGRVEIQSADIDGTAIPRVALEFFVSHYITPKYPDVGMTSTFKLPYRIDTAVVGQGTLTITQK
jgi:hypothetical protein